MLYKIFYPLLLFGCIMFASAISMANEQEQGEADGEFLSLPDVTVFGSNMPVDIAKYPGSVTVLGEDDLFRYRSLEDALSSQIPGLTLNEYSLGRPFGSYISIRGFSAAGGYVVIKQDGIERDPVMYGNFASSLRMDTSILKTVEVIQGSSSDLHGGSFGGVIATQTKDAQDYIKPGKTVGFVSETNLNTQNAYSQSLTAAFDFKNIPLDFLLHGKLETFGDVRQASSWYFDKVQDDGDIGSIFTKLGWDITDEQRLELSYSFWDGEVISPYSYHNGQTEIDPNSSIRNNMSQKDALLRYELNPISTDWINLDASIYYSAAKNDRFYTDGDPFRQIYSDDRYGVNLQNLSLFSTGKFIDHSLVVGLNYELKKTDYYIYGGSSSMHPNTTDELGIFIQDDITFFDRVTLTLGLRYDYYKAGADESSYSYDMSELSPRVGLAVEVYEGINLLANYSETFKAPTMTQVAAEGYLQWFRTYLPNPNLEAEEGQEYELGISVDKTDFLLDNDHFYFKLMYFKGRFENFIGIEDTRFTATPPASWNDPTDPDYSYYQGLIAQGYPLLAQYVNADTIVHRKGWELLARYSYGPWSGFASYETIDIYYDGGEEYNEPGYSDKIRLGLSYLHRPWEMMFSADAEHWITDHDPEYSSSGTKYVDDDFTRVNLSVTWVPTKTGFDFLDTNFELVLGIKNLFDAPITSSGDSDPIYPNEGINFYTNIKFKF